MKSRYIILAATLVALNSCESLNTPIYYDDYGTPVAPPQTQANGIPKMPANFNQLPPSSAPAIPGYKRPRDLSGPSPFMQPDVYAPPSKRDLEETATSTRGSSGSQGLGVPSR